MEAATRTSISTTGTVSGVMGRTEPPPRRRSQGPPQHQQSRQNLGGRDREILELQLSQRAERYGQDEQVHGQLGLEKNE